MCSNAVVQLRVIIWNMEAICSVYSYVYQNLQYTTLIAGTCANRLRMNILDSLRNAIQHMATQHDEMSTRVQIVL